MKKPLCIDLYCGLGGWSDGFTQEGYWCVGFDIELHDYGAGRYPGDLVIQDVLTLHGSQFKDATVIVGSSPCQKYSYMAMPWKRGKALAAWYREDPARIEELNALFNAQFRIQEEACAASGRYIPLVVENVRGAQAWVGRSKARYGSFHLWGDVPALMPFAKTLKGFGGTWFHNAELGTTNPNRSRTAEDPRKVPGFNFHQHEKTGKPGGSFQSAAVKVQSEEGRRTDIGKGARFTSRDCGVEAIALKGAGGGWFNDLKRDGKGETGYLSRSGSKSPARKAASAMIAKIPLPLSKWIAKCYYPCS